MLDVVERDLSVDKVHSFCSCCVDHHSYADQQHVVAALMFGPLLPSLSLGIQIVQC